MGAFLSGVWSKVAFAAVFAVMFLAAVLKIRQGGADAERAKAQGKILKDVETRHEIDRAVAGDANPADSLQQRWSRD